MKKTYFITMITAALMGSAYANTDYTATPESPRTSAPDYIFSAFAETGNATGGYVEIREVEEGGYASLGVVRSGRALKGDSTGNTVSISGGSVSQIYGGDSSGGVAADNTVTMSGGKANVIYCGYSQGKATDNSLTINGGEVTTSAYGAFAGAGEASNNTVTLNDGKVGEVYGCYAKDFCDAFGNAVIINGGVVASYVYGGMSVLGDATGNTVNMSGGAVDGYVYGGYAGDTGEATGNTVTMTDGYVYNDVRGGYSYTGNATGNTVNMSGGEVDEDVYGGFVEDSGDATGNTVVLNNGDVNDDVCAGLTYKGEVSGNIVLMNGGSVSTGVYGAYTYDGNATDNTVLMAGGSAGYVYGGGGGAGGVCVATGNTVTMSGGEVAYDVYGGYVEGDGNATDNTVNMTGGVVGDDVYGGFVEGDGDAIGNTVTMSGGEVDDEVFGGYTYSGNATGNAVDMTGGYFDCYVYGGYTDSGDATRNTVILSNSIVNGAVCAGYTYEGEVSGNTVIMTGGEVGGGLYGGYTDSGDATGNTVHMVGEGASYTAGDTTYQGSQIEIQRGVHAGCVVKNGVSSNNSVHVYGTGISIGGTIDSSEQLTFHLVQGQAGAPGTPMVTLGGSLDLEGVELGFYGDSVTDWAAFNGKSITLVSMTNETITGLVTPTDSVDITDEAGKTVATATLTLSEDLQTLFLTDIQGVGPVPPPVPAAEADALDVTLVNSLWASSAYVREFVRLSEAQGYSLKSGDTAVWGGGFGTFMHVTGDKGFKSDGGGYGIGVRHAFSANTQAGISLGQGFGSYHNSGADGATVHQRAILATATASTRIGKDLSLGGHLAFGSVRNRADCRLDGESGRARWNDNVFNLGVQAAYDFHVTDTTAITPFLGLDWMNGAHESFGGAYGRHYSHGRLNELRMPVGVTVSTSAEVGSTKLLPQLSVAYVPSLAQQLPHADVSGENGDYRVKGYAPGRNAFMLNAGVNAVFSDSWSAGAFYTLETRRHCVDQSVNASVRYTF